MGIDTDDDIRTDFLAEAGELLARLGEQLIDLEQRPDDRELLNAVFRGFHTIKGGAGFLALTPMVALCHAAEDSFNALRNGSVAMSPSLMDAVLEAVEHLQTMLNAAAARTALADAPALLIERLNPVDAAKLAPPPPKLLAPPPVTMPTAGTSSGAAISDDEFEALLDQYQGGAAINPAAPEPVVPPAPPAAAATAQPLPSSSSAPAAAAADHGIRVDTAVLDGLMNLVGELVLVRNRLTTLCTQSRQDPYARAIGELDHITRGLQATVMRARMQPIRKVLSRFPRLAREVARGLDKQVEVELSGEDTGLDKNLVEALADPLLHMVRNSIDHGIEMPRARLDAGKPASGRLRLAAEQTGDHILITVADDGAGIDPERLRRKAIEKGLIDATDASSLTASECLQLVFLPGLSTRDQISELSGRGVGMDVVQSSITALGGAVQIESRLGFGTQVQIRVPLTLAILPALMVAIGTRAVALPLAPVLDVFVLDETRLRKLDSWDVMLYRATTLRLIDLHRWMETGSVRIGPRHVVVAEVSGERFGFIVSEVHGREEVVIKPLGALLRGLSGLAGATVTGDGRIALILDLLGVVRANTSA